MKKAVLLVVLGIIPISLHAESDPLVKIAHHLAGVISMHKNAKVAVLTIPYFDNRSSDGPYILSERLTSQLSTDKKLVVLERNHINDVLAELKLSASGLMDLKTTKKIGEALGADIIVTGTLVDVEKGQTALNVRALIADSGRIIGAYETIVPRTWGHQPIEEIEASRLTMKPIKTLASSLLHNIPAPRSHSLAVMNFLYTRNRVSSGSYLVPECVLTYLVQDGALVIERRLLQKYFEERHLMETGVVSAASIKSMADVMGVDMVIIGTLSDLDSGDTEVIARAIDVQTTKVLAAATTRTPRLWRDSPKPPWMAQAMSPVPAAFPMLPSREGPSIMDTGHTLSDLDHPSPRHIYRPAPVPLLMPQKFMD